MKAKFFSLGIFATEFLFSIGELDCNKIWQKINVLLGNYKIRIVFFLASITLILCLHICFVFANSLRMYFSLNATEIIFEKRGENPCLEYKQNYARSHIGSTTLNFKFLKFEKIIIKWEKIETYAKIIIKNNIPFRFLKIYIPAVTISSTLSLHMKVISLYFSSIQVWEDSHQNATSILEEIISTRNTSKLCKF